MNNMRYSLRSAVILFSLVAIWMVVAVSILVSVLSSREIRSEMEDAELEIVTSCFGSGEQLLQSSMETQYQQVADRGAEKTQSQIEDVSSLHYSTMAAVVTTSYRNDWRAYSSDYQRSKTLFSHEPTLLLHAWWSYDFNVSYAVFRHEAHAEVISLFNNGSLQDDLLYENRNGVTNIVFVSTYPLYAQLSMESRLASVNKTVWKRAANDTHTLSTTVTFSDTGTTPDAAFATSFSAASVDISSVTAGMSDEDLVRVAIISEQGDVIKVVNREMNDPLFTKILAQVVNVTTTETLQGALCNKNKTSIVVDGEVFHVYGSKIEPSKPNYEPTGWCVMISSNSSHVSSLFSGARTTATVVIDKSTDRARNETLTWITILIAITVSFAIIVSLFSAVGANYVTKPLLKLRSDMDHVTDLRLEGSFRDLPRSRFREIALMQASFSALCEAVSEFKQYMPQAVVERGSEIDMLAEHHHIPSSSSSDSESDECLPPAVSSTHRSRPVQSTDSFSVSNEQSNRSTLLGESSTFEAVSPNYPPVMSDKDESPVGAVIKTQTTEVKTPTNTGLSKNERYKTEDIADPSQKKRANLSVYLQRRKGISHVSLSCKDFDEYMRQLPDPALVVEFHSKWIGCCVADAKINGGVVERFIGDCVDINFGGLQSCINAANKATGYALKVRDRIFTAKNRQSEGFNFPETFLCCGIASGSGFVGNLGNTGLKTPAVVGRAVMYSKAMLCISRETGMDIIVDQRCADELKGIYKSVPVDILRYNEGSKKQICSYVFGAHNAPAGEWMYVVDTQTETAYEKAWSLLRRSDNIPSVVSVVDAMFAIQDDPLARIVGSRIKCYLDEVILLTGKPPKDYYRIFRPKGCTVIIPENVRRSSAKYTGKGNLTRSHRNTQGSLSSFSSSQPISFARASEVSANSASTIIKSDSLKERPSNKTHSSPAQGSDIISQSTSTSG